MEYFNLFEKYGHEQVIFNVDPEVKLRAIIAIHNTVLGPALGGCRMRKYSSEADAVMDVLKLSRGMTYKNAAADLPYGGGKAVIIGDPSIDKTPELMKSFGRFVQTLQGRFTTGPDMGTNLDDFKYAKRYTPYVITWEEKFTTPDDISLNTAYGVYMGIKACLKQVYGDDSLDGRVIAIQGLGKVGYNLCNYLSEEGAKLLVSGHHRDKIDRVIKEFNAKEVGVEEIYSVQCDVFSPNAVGAILNNNTIPKFKCKIVAGGANNVLLNEKEHDIKLYKRSILYAPDYVINAGGVIAAAQTLTSYEYEKAREKVDNIYNILLKIFSISKDEDIPTHKAANVMVERKINKARKKRKIYYKL